MLVVVVLLCAWALAWPVWLAQFPLEIDLKEPWIAYQVNALRAHALYPPPGGLVSNNYPPLFFLLLEAMAGPDGDVIMVGRMLSLLGTLAIGVSVAFLVRSFGGSIAGAVLGGAWFVGTLSRYADRYVAMNDPQLLGLAMMMVGLVLLRAPDRRIMYLGLLSVAAGGFFKNSLIATPLAAPALLALTRGRREALAAAAFLVGCVLLGLVICALAFGQNFLPQLLFYPRDMSPVRSLRSLERLGSILPALLMWGAWAWSEPKSVGARFTAIYAALGLGAYLLQKTADLIDVNAQFELTAALAVGLGLAIDRLPRTAAGARFGAGRVRLAGIFLLALWLVRLSRPEPLLLLTSDAFRATVRGNATVVASEVARVAAIAGDVACVYQTICYRAGKPFVFDVTYAVASGRITQQQADQGIAVPGVVMIDIDRRVSARALACRNCR